MQGTVTYDAPTAHTRPHPDAIAPPEERQTAGQDGCPEFSQVYEEYYRKVVAYATKLLGPEDAEDVAQEVFLKISRSIGSLSEPSKLTSWIYAITLNTVRDMARARSSRPLCSSTTGTLSTPQDDPLSEVPDTASRSAQEMAIWNQMVACFLDYVRELPQAYYQVYVLSEFDDMPNAQIARRLSLSLGTVKIRLHRARTQLYGALRRNCRCYYNERGELMGEPRERPSDRINRPTASP